MSILNRSEKSIEQAAVKYALKVLGIKSIKLSVGGGWPDRFFLVPGGKALFIEFKKPGNELEPLQQVRFDELRELGYEVWMCNNLKDAKEIIMRARQCL